MIVDLIAWAQDICYLPGTQMGIGQAEIIKTGVAVATVTAVGYRLLTRGKRYHGG